MVEETMMLVVKRLPDASGEVWLTDCAGLGVEELEDGCFRDCLFCCCTGQGVMPRQGLRFRRGDNFSPLSSAQLLARKRKPSEVPMIWGPTISPLHAHRTLAQH